MKLRILCLALLLSACTPGYDPATFQAKLEQETGLRPAAHDGSTVNPEPGYLAKTHRGYPVLLRMQMGEVWGRFATRVAMSEIGRAQGGIWSFLTGARQHVGTVVGSPLDRLLSEVIGDPVTILAVMKHDHPNAPRVDIYSMFANYKPSDPQPERKYLGLAIGTLYSDNSRASQQLLENKVFIERVGNFMSPYIRLDEHAATFTFGGSENEYSTMIRNFGGYNKFLNAIMDTLADLSDLD